MTTATQTYSEAELAGLNSEAMRINADMLRDIQEEGFASGILFAWIDELRARYPDGI